MHRPRGPFVRLHARLHDERGFSMVEAMIAGMILAVGAFGVAQALGFGLKTTGISRQRVEAEALANEQLELARTLNYDQIVLQEPGVTDPPIAHDPDPESPDYWVTDGTPPLYDPDADGPLDPEPMLIEFTQPSLLHYQADVIQGNTTYTIYTYVTWVDSPVDGLGGSDVAHDWDDDGIEDDPNGQDQKRVSIVVQWPNSFGTAVSHLHIGSLFSVGNIAYQSGEGAPNQPPSVACPEATVNGGTVNFTASAGDVDGSIIRVDWDFGDGTVIQDVGANFTQSHTYTAPGSYQIVNLVFDNGSPSASASNGDLACTVEVVDVSPSPPPDDGAPSCNILIENGAVHATSTNVTLYLTSEPAPATMQFSSGGDFGAEIAYSLTTLYTMPAGDGTKTVSARFISAEGVQSAVCSDTIILDTTPPGPPLSFTVVRAGNKKSATLQWQPPSPIPLDLGGYQVWRRATTAQTFTQISCNYSGPTTCVDASQNNKTNYEYYVVAVDIAGNQGAESNHQTV